MQHKGMTLLESMIAMSLALVVMSAFLGLYIYAKDVYRKEFELYQTQAKMQQITHQFNQELLHLKNYGEIQYAYKKLNLSYAEAPTLVFRKLNSLQYIIHSPLKLKRGQSLLFVSSHDLSIRKIAWVRKVRGKPEYKVDLDSALTWTPRGLFLWVKHQYYIKNESLYFKKSRAVEWLRGIERMNVKQQKGLLDLNFTINQRNLNLRYRAPI